MSNKRSYRHERKKAYRLYLQSEHWKSLRESAIVRDGGKCNRCQSDENIQVHHLVYRTPWETGILEDLETVCRKCHRLEHGLCPTDAEYFAMDIQRDFLNKMTPPPASVWKEFKSLLTGSDDDNLLFGEVMFQYILYAHANRREGFKKDWWMTPEKGDYWRNLAWRVRSKLTHRNQ